MCAYMCVCVFIDHTCPTCVRARVHVDERESRGELRGCGQSDALPQNREGPDPTGIEREPLHLTPLHPMTEGGGLNYWNIDATGH